MTETYLRLRKQLDSPLPAPVWPQGIAPAAFDVVVGRRPARVAIDPYYKLIDRNRGDNVRAVVPAGARAGR